MNLPLLYQWQALIDKAFPDLGRWQKRTLALLSYGVILAHSCVLVKVSQHLHPHLPCRVQVSSLERQFQRWLSNERRRLKGLGDCWVKWVLQVWGKAPLLVLIDETKLSDHVAVMMVGVAYHATAIPLLWRAYHPMAYPEEGQVAIMQALLEQLRSLLPTDQTALRLADRGLGTSPTWQAHLSATGWHYLLRVQRSTLIRLPHRQPQPLRRLVSYGQSWCGYGEVFKKAGWQRKWVYLHWEVGYREPLCLFSNQPDLSPLLYARRFHQEAGFRDLKSDGFQWQRSHIWLPAHVERLLLVLALATFWTLTEGTRVLLLYPLTRRQQRLSVFRLGLDALFQRFHSGKRQILELFLAPDPPLIKTVVP